MSLVVFLEDTKSWVCPKDGDISCLIKTLPHELPELDVEQTNYCLINFLIHEVILLQFKLLKDAIKKSNKTSLLNLDMERISSYLLFGPLSVLIFMISINFP